jgi:leader peptidase (prepilin peptidase)/N-methyltransferase
MVPLVSFLVLRGRCRHCGEAIGWFHPGVELAATAVAACAFALDPDRAWIGCGLGWTLLTLSWIDWRSFLLPDVLTLPLLLSGLVICALDDPDDLTDHAIACVFGYGSFQALGWAYRRLRGRDGLGGGDAKLIAVAGLLAALGLALSGRSVTSTTRIPFGPCIALAFWLVWLDPLFGGP